MHRLLLPETEVDHKSGDGLDNRRSNLRSATRSQNQANKFKKENTSSRFKGVYQRRNYRRFRAHIRVHGEEIHVGDFDSEIEAARAYDAAARKYHGEFARLNFPNPGEQAALPVLKAAA